MMDYHETTRTQPVRLEKPLKVWFLSLALLGQASFYMS